MRYALYSKIRNTFLLNWFFGHKSRKGSVFQCNQIGNHSSMEPYTRSSRALSELIAILRSKMIPYTTEKDCQAHIRDLLDSYGATYSAEYRLGDDIIDFYFPRSKLAAEVKVLKSWSKIEVYRQCERYLKHDDVAGLLLVTAKSQGMPEKVCDKPVRVFYLGANAI